MRSRTRGLLVGGTTVAIAAVAMLALGLGWFGAEAASAHPGHSHEGEDGRLPAQPDFDRVGKTTYRFNEAREEYVIRHPGRPTAYAHYDHEFEGLGVEELAAGPQELDRSGGYLGELGTCGSGAGQLGGLMNGPNLAAGPGGELWIATGGAHRVQKWEPAG